MTDQREQPDQRDRQKRKRAFARPRMAQSELGVLVRDELVVSTCTTTARA